MEFDSLIIADWPRGLYLAKELSTKGDKTAYLEITPYLKRPFPLFMRGESQEKAFLEKLGFLSLQEEGFCFLSSGGVFLAREQTLKEKLKSLSKNRAFNKSSLQESLFSYLENNLAGRVFQFNDSYLSQDKLNLFSDCFLFEPSFRKKQDFQKNQISFLSMSLDQLYLSVIPKEISSKQVYQSQTEFLIKKHLGLSAKNLFCLSDRLLNLTHPADFQWKACFFKADLGAYESVIPEHFVIIKELFFPWCYDNLLSVFQKKGVLELWMRLPFEREETEFIKKAQQNLEDFFPGAYFQFKKQELLKSFYVYGKEILNSYDSPLTKNSKDFFQASLCQDISHEIQLTKKLIKT